MRFIKACSEDARGYTSCQQFSDIANLAEGQLNLIDEEIQKTVNKEHAWKSVINDKNQSNLKQIELMWRKMGWFVGTLEVPQQEIKDGTMVFIQKGKELTHERIKVIRFADHDGYVT